MRLIGSLARSSAVRLLTVSAGSLLCALLWAQAPSTSTAEVTTKEVPLTFKSGVDLVPVPVVVRDDHGKAVGNLGIDDFQLYDNGKAQLISKFSVEKLSNDAAPATPHQPPPANGEALADAQPDGIPDRFVAYLFDDSHMSPAELIYTRDAARRRIDSAAPAKERVAIYTTSGRPFQEFTSDREKLHSALGVITTGRGDATTSFQQNSCPPMTYYMADLIYNKQDDVALQIAVADAIKCANLDPTHAQEIDLATTMAKQAARQGVFHGDQETMASLETLRNVVSRMGTIPGQRTIVLISSGFSVLNALARDEQTALIGQAIRSNIVINALDARGLFVPTILADASQHPNTEGIASGPGVIPQKDSYGKMESTIQSGEMATIAEGTGGRYYQNSNNYDEGISRAAASPEYLYVLGFSPLDLKLDGKYHNLKVTLKSPKGMDIQVRKGYYAPNHATSPEEQAKQQIQEAVFSRDEVHDLPAVLQTQFFKTGDNDATLSALAKIDVKNLHLRKDEGRNLDNLTVVTGLFDNDGNYISGVQKTVELRLLDETLEKRAGSGIAVKSSFAVHSGGYLVRLVVRDSEGQTMAEQSSRVEIP